MKAFYIELVLSGVKYHDENTIMPIERAFDEYLELRVYAPDEPPNIEC